MPDDATLNIHRDGEFVYGCDDGTHDPCVVERHRLADGDAVATVRSSRDGDWSLFGVSPARGRVRS